MEKTEWPSSYRLSALRKEGRFAYSAVGGRLLIAATVTIAIVSLGAAWGGLLDSYRNLFSQGLSASDGATRTALVSALILMFHVLSWSAITVGLVHILLSSRFLFKPSLLTLDFARLNPFYKRGEGSVFTRLLITTVALIVSLTVGALVLLLFSSEVIMLLNRDKAYFINWPHEFLYPRVPVVLFAFLAGAVGSWFYSWRKFRLRHRMTMRELRDETGD